MPKKEEFDPAWFDVEDKSAKLKSKSASDEARETRGEIWESLQCLEDIKATAHQIKSNQQQSLELTKGIHSMLSFFKILAAIGLLLILAEILVTVFHKQ